jgi:4-carboxymuconolactone decarboxylase
VSRAGHVEAGPSRLEPGVEVLVRVSAAIGAGRRDVLADALRDALDLPRVEVDEALLQSHLFVGYPATIGAFALWRRIAGPAPAGAGIERSVDFDERGARVCERVYGGQYGRVRANVAALHPELERWMLRDGYGRVLGRPGLALAARELCVVAVLCAQDAEPQLYSHMRGALQSGATGREVEATLRVAEGLLPADRREAAWRVWTSVRERRTGGRG